MKHLLVKLFVLQTNITNKFTTSTLLIKVQNQPGLKTIMTVLGIIKSGLFVVLLLIFVSLLANQVNLNHLKICIENEST